MDSWFFLFQRVFLTWFFNETWNYTECLKLKVDSTHKFLNFTFLVMFHLSCQCYKFIMHNMLHKLWFTSIPYLYSTDSMMALTYPNIFKLCMFCLCSRHRGFWEFTEFYNTPKSILCDRWENCNLSWITTEAAILNIYRLTALIYISSIDLSSLVNTVDILNVNMLTTSFNSVISSAPCNMFMQFCFF